MLESAESGLQVAKQEYDDQLPGLRVELINAQYDLQSADFPVIVLLCGDDQLAVRAALRGMHEWMDGRFIESRVYPRPTEDQRNYPAFWRYWRRLPRKGRLGVFFNAWAAEPYRHTIIEHAGKKALNQDLAHIRHFEQALADDGALIIKLWFHISRAEFNKRLKRLKKRGEGWRIDPMDVALVENYDETIPLAERFLEETSTESCPWHLIDSTDGRHAALTSGRIIRDAVTRRLSESAPAPAAPSSRETEDDIPDQLSPLDMSASLGRKEYVERLGKAKAEVSALTDRAYKQGVASILAFEGWDAGGKGGAIRRLTAAIDIRDFRVISIGAPTEEELAHHYLWRFWSHIPPAGRTTVFDRTWYGRVLVERIEGFAREDEWRRAYAEIRDFEEQLTERGAVVQKFWLHIDSDEQLARFKAREKTSFKRHKITDEDYRNREKWDDYVQAVNEMVARTNTKTAPWHIIPANNKRYARVAVMETYAEALRKKLDSL